MLTVTACTHWLPFNANIMIIGSVSNLKTTILPLLHPSAIIRCTDTPTIALQHFMEQQPDIILIDSDIAFHAIQSLIIHFRRFSSASMIQIGQDNNRQERIQALSAGVDYWLSSPIDTDELTAIMKNAFRHSKTKHKLTIEANEYWSYCRLNRRLYSPSGFSIQLTPNELRIIDVIAKHSGDQKIIARHTFATALNRTNSEGFDKLLHVSIGRLRKKIATACGEFFPLASIRSSGFRFESQITLVSEIEH